MSLEEYENAIDDWYTAQHPLAQTEYEYAREKAKAWDIQEEYFFMKGWAARNV